jgi:hypothetical protein
MIREITSRWRRLSRTHSLQFFFSSDIMSLRSNDKPVTCVGAGAAAEYNAVRGYRGVAVRKCVGNILSSAASRIRHFARTSAFQSIVQRLSAA